MSELSREELRSALLSLLEDLSAGPVTPARARAEKARLDAISAQDVVAVVHRAVQARSGGDLRALEAGVARFMRLAAPGLEAGRLSVDDAEGAPALIRELVAENRAFARALAAFKPTARLLASAHEADSLRAFGEFLDGARKFLTHYIKKENVLFPRFEARYPEWACVRVMWSLHDDFRDALRELESMRVAGAPSAELHRALGRLYFAAGSGIDREELALFPVIVPLFGDDEWEAMRREARGFGVYPSGDRASAPEPRASGLEMPNELHIASAGRDESESVRLSHGNLPVAWLDAILKRLPCDLTFVDADGRVRYFSDAPDRVFPRSPSIIGRDVRNCHPSKSLARVEALMARLRSGEAEREAFWLELNGRFVHIEYRAVRDEGGKFLGTLEISEDITEKRGRSGEKRL
jgi:hypothetical protein